MCVKSYAEYVFVIFFHFHPFEPSKYKRIRLVYFSVHCAIDIAVVVVTHKFFFVRQKRISPEKEKKISEEKKVRNKIKLKTKVF